MPRKIKDGEVVVETPLMTIAEAAAYLRIKIHTLDTWRSTKRVVIPFHRIGRNVVYAKADLDAFLASCKEGA